MRLNNAGIKILHDFEGLRLTSYLCPAGVWTIGYGNTFYEDGSAVKRGDVITQERADRLFVILLDQFAAQVRPLIKQPLNNNQFGALLSFAYNVGVGGRLQTQPPGLRRSTLLRLVNANPNDPLIRQEFAKWTRAGGQVLNGLVRRRAAEADLYFTPNQ
jgi:lysozyme